MCTAVRFKKVKLHRGVICGLAQGPRFFSACHFRVAPLLPSLGGPLRVLPRQREPDHAPMQLGDGDLGAPGSFRHADVLLVFTSWSPALDSADWTSFPSRYRSKPYTAQALRHIHRRRILDKLAGSELPSQLAMDQPRCILLQHSHRMSCTGHQSYGRYRRMLGNPPILVSQELISLAFLQKHSADFK